MLKLCFPEIFFHVLLRQLVPIQVLSVFKRPEVLGFLALAAITIINSRNRFGALVGGALPISPAGATDLWSTYFESWHQVGLGSASATPPWVAVIAIASLAVLSGNIFSRIASTTRSDPSLICDQRGGI